MTKFKTIALFSGIAVLSTVSLAGEPVENVSAKHHVNLAHAQQAIESAYNDLDAAQKANNDDMKGHASKAKELLQQADAEVKLAAEAANAADAEKRKEAQHK